ncbi:AbrB/MazE/SpoVT family DNA-binding domain-containing protein [candidate division KSB1 bacterium]|nr:AbrB/MazE/SpoVT family DNA-binding domain-containing protein [candidate division KSB1 bacterium]
MLSATISSKGAVVIPKEIRKKYAIEAGKKVFFIENENGVELRSLSGDPVNALRGSMKTDKSALELLHESRVQDTDHEASLEQYAKGLKNEK